MGCATNKIASIQPGMTMDQVREIKGKPISTEFDQSTTSWLYKDLKKFSPLTGPDKRYYWVVFDKGDKVIAVKDAGAVQLKGGSASSEGMGFLCKDAIARGDDAAIRTHCR